MLTDFPKLHCPFVRKTFTLSDEVFQNHRRTYNLRSPDLYLVVDEVNPDYEWVFNDEDTFCTEKLDGTNVKMLTKDGRLEKLQNRNNVLDPLQVVKGRNYIIEGVFKAIQKGYVSEDGEQAGELLGPKLQGNPYGLDYHLWYPFDKAVKSLKYKSFHNYEPNFDNLSSWFERNLFSLLSKRFSPDSGRVFAEGVIFYNLKRKAEGKIYMAKLRRNMFNWYYRDLVVPGYEK